MDNKFFEQKYSEDIQPLYGNIRDTNYDKEMLKKNSIPHKYTIFDRIDMTNLEVYSIDPIGCEDADDAFSIYLEQDE